jgi:hypothetical protein
MHLTAVARGTFHCTVPLAVRHAVAYRFGPEVFSGGTFGIFGESDG